MKLYLFFIFILCSVSVSALVWPVQDFEGDNVDLGVGCDFGMIVDQQWNEGSLFVDNATITLNGVNTSLGENISINAWGLTGSDWEVVGFLEINIPEHPGEFFGFKGVVPNKTFRMLAGHNNGVCFASNITESTENETKIILNESIIGFVPCDIKEFLNGNLTGDQVYYSDDLPYIEVDDVVYTLADLQWNLSRMNINLSYSTGVGNVSHNVTCHIVNLTDSYDLSWSFNITNTSPIVEPIVPVEEEVEEEEHRSHSGGGSGSSPAPFITRDNVSDVVIPDEVPQVVSPLINKPKENTTPKIEPVNQITGSTVVEQEKGFSWIYLVLIACLILTGIVGWFIYNQRGDHREVLE